MRQYEPVSLLVVGDTRQDREALLKILSDCSLRALSLGTSAQLAAVPVDSPPGLVLTEYRVPDASWLGVMEAARRRWPHVQTVVWSRFADEQMWSEVVCLGGFDVLPVPFDGDETLRVIAAAMREARLKERHLGELRELQAVSPDCCEATDVKPAGSLIEFSSSAPRVPIPPRPPVACL
jgi:DNA-binding NtrC family response regulator